jgi:DNA-binding MarR family transcriptional regulator
MSPPAPGPDERAARVWAAMRDLAVSYPPREALREELGLGRGSGRVKAMLVLRRGPVSLSELADAVRVDAPYATIIVDTLEERGLVERRPDPVDRRRKLVELTEAGTEMAERARSLHRRPPPGFDELTDGELAALESLVARIVAGSPLAGDTTAVRSAPM